MSLPAGMRTDVILATVASTANFLARIEGLEQLYFEGLRDAAQEALASWPGRGTMDRRQWRRYRRRVEPVLEEIEAGLGAWLERHRKTPGAVGILINALMAQVQDLYDELRRHNSRNLHLLDPILDMLRQYAGTLEADSGRAIDLGLEIAAIFDEAIEAGGRKAALRRAA